MIRTFTGFAIGCGVLGVVWASTVIYRTETTSQRVAEQKVVDTLEERTLQIRGKDGEPLATGVVTVTPTSVDVRILPSSDADVTDMRPGRIVVPGTD